MTSPPPAEPMPVIVRAYAPTARTRPGKPPPQPSGWVVIFDCETTDDTYHSLRFGGFQVRRDGVLKRHGFFYDPDMLDADELAVLLKTASVDGAEVLSLPDFVQDVFFRCAYDLGGMCVGFNLPFDLSRLATGHVVSASRDAFSFDLCESRKEPRVRVRHRDGTSAKMEFVSRGARREHDHRGHFLDVRTLARALTGSSHSLKSLARTLGTPHRKRDAPHGERLQPVYVRYCANDVQVTWECFAALRDRFDSYGLTETPITSVMSEAGIGKGALRQMGIKPWRDVQPDFPEEVTGKIMSAYFGGRSEIRERRRPVEVVYCDFLSMYPTSCANTDLWQFVIAQGVDTYEATAETRDFLRDLTVEQLQDPETWKDLAVIVEVEPDGDRLEPGWLSRRPG